ncbi:MAG: hypothetical protein HY659_11530 [Rhizobiales bacterium]|nr:hypothetical protein [Hyphomicrobiales bacterium]
MNIESKDLDAAIEAGVVTLAQADALRAFVAVRERSRIAILGHEDERFRFMRGFNDFFFAIGILLFGFGVNFFTGGLPVPNLVAAGIIWVLSELLVRRMRLVLPGILLSIFFVIFVFQAVPFDLSSFTSPPPPQLRGPLWSNLLLGGLGLSGASLAVTVKALIAASAAGLYYWRFRLPFALLPIAVSLVLAVISVVAMIFGTLPALAHSLVILACGLGVFAVAMTFDASDRDRVTRYSDCAFWLHLFAAPLIVHSLISLITPNVFNVTNTVAISILLIVAMLALVAIAIDRRALLVSALLYVGAIISYAIAGTNFTAIGGGSNQGAVFFATLLILGTSVIALGVGWIPLRKWLIAHISLSIASKLPPVPNRV